MKTLRALREWILKDPVFGLLLVAPLLLLVLVTLIYPLFYTTQLSFLNVRFLGAPSRYIGFANYSRVLQDRDFWESLARSLWWTLSNVILQAGGSLLVALILNQKFKGRSLVRNWIVLPWVLPTVVLAIMWLWILDPTLGVVNYLLITAGLINEPIKFFASHQWALPTTILINVWRWTPYFAILMLAALQTVRQEIIEAALVDGASIWQRFWHITVPAISPMLRVVTLVSFLWSVNIFDTIWLLTRGGPLDFTTTLPILIYQKAFQEFRFSVAAAISVLLFLILLGFSIYYLRSLFREESLT